MKQDFLNYIKQTFNFSDTEMKDFEESLSKPLKKSIRVNTNKISVEDFKKIAETKWWKLTSTSMWKNTFYIDRFEDLDIALWNTLEHINWFFYIQELAASSSPYYMSWDVIDKEQYLILDMSASPGWKTTQLSEYYPNSLVIANEIDKQRLKWLFVNLDRMWSLNVASTNFDWRNFKNYEEIFDKVLLDAPCSGEWTAYKTDDSLKYRNIKNIKSIQKLQLSLLDSAVVCTKVWWEIVYSTCTLNTLENEEVVNTIMEKYAWCLEIIPLNNGKCKIENGKIDVASANNYLNDSEINSEWHISKLKTLNSNLFIRNWPHISHTWWFFVAKIKKIKSLCHTEWNEMESKYPLNSNNSQNKIQGRFPSSREWQTRQKETIQNFEKLSSKDTKLIEKSLETNFWYSAKWKKFYRYKDEIHMIDKSLEDLWKKIFFYKIWVKIWELKNGSFEPDFYLGTLEIFEKNTVLINDEILNNLYKWEEISLNFKDWYYQIYCKNWELISPAWIVKIKNWKAKSLIATKAMRK